MIPPFLRRLALALLLSLALVAGAAADPFEVATYADLCKVGTGADGWTLDADYIQTADIQCPMDEDFPMICRYPTPFTGTYDGNGYEIQNMQIHTADSYCGLFVLLGSTAEVRDVHLVDVDIDAYTSRVGALAGESQGQVSECTVSGTVAGAWGVGGLIGQMSSGNVTGCIFSGNVSAPSHFGGLIGVMTSGSVEECSSSGFTTGQYNGGLIGQLNGGTVTRCNSSVRVIGNSCGGLIGQMTAGSVAWCNATGDVGALVSDGSDFGRGGLVGRLDGGTLSDSSATGSISGSNHLGGFVGYGSGMITRCFATGGIQRSIGCSEMFLAGGFVGRLDDGTLTECYATGDVLNASYLSGGFLGTFEYGSVTDSYATGDVTVVVAGENRHAGGFIGRWGVWRNGPAGSITNCYSTGHVTAPAGSTDVGGFVGGLDTVSGPPATTSYWDTETSGQAASTGGAVGKTTAEMKTIATFAGWNIATPATYTDEVWYIVEGEDYPRLAWQGLPTLPPVAAFTASPTSGMAPLAVQFTDASTNAPTAWSWNFGDGGTSDQQHPSHTYNEPGTYTVSLTATNAHGSDTKTMTGVITVYSAGPRYVATYADLCKVGTGADGWTLDADYIQTADIQCPAEEDFPIIGRNEIFEGSYDGGNHTIRGLSITSSDYSVGMFSRIGGGATLKNIKLDNCNVSGIDNVGGLSGISYGATVTNCGITGLVQGEDTIGGLIGFAVDDPLYISNCIAEINVSGSGSLGGIVGELNAQNSLIDNCSFTGSIEGTGGPIGGITGLHYSGCLIRNCTASEVIIIGYSRNIGGISGEAYGGSTDGCYVSGTIRGEGTQSAGGLIGFNAQNGYVKNSTTSVTVTGSGNVGGLIGQNSGGPVDNCHVSGSVATSGDYDPAGGLVGYSQASVSNCTASGSVAGNGGPIGGLIGGAFEGTHFQCSASGAVTNMGEGPTGGLFGQLGGSATECYATGPVTGVSFCGGFVGGCWGGSITDCYATGSVTADGGHHIGGFAGGGSQSIVNCYSTGLVTATNVPGDLIGYLGGFSGDGDVPSSCFWNTETSGQATSTGGAVGKTTAEMKTIATFAGWNIATPAEYTDEVWYIVPGEDYPRLAWEGVPSVAPAPAPPPSSAHSLPYSEQRKDTMGFLLMCWGALPFVGVFCIVIFLVMNGAQRGSGGI